MNFSMVFAASSASVYDPYATSHFQGHSLITTANVIHGIVRVVGYPLLAKVADVSRIQCRRLRGTMTDVLSYSTLGALKALPELSPAWPSPTFCMPHATTSRHTWSVPLLDIDYWSACDSPDTVLGRRHLRGVWRCLVDYYRADLHRRRDLPC